MKNLEGLAKIHNYCTLRISSYDRTGGNADFVPIKPGETKAIAEIGGAGCIRHIWFGGGVDEKCWLRKVVLRMYWDGERNPSVESPLGDFFGAGHGIAGNYWSLPLSMKTADNPERPAMNCWFPMPFAKSARIELTNECGKEFSAYFYIDYQKYEKLPGGLGRFHAQWRRENPCKAVKFKEGEPETNLTGKENYVILEAEGRGHYVGCNVSVHQLAPGWYGEGDDMIFIDGEKWPPSFHGTGTEDYFCSSYEFPVDGWCTPFHGVSLAGSDRLRDWERMEGKTNKWTVYRFHIEDPIVFKKSIKVTIEHGHANDRSDDWASVAYWYQKEPHKKFPEMPGVEKRL